MDIPGELVEQLRKGNVILFCGAGISASEGGLPGGSQLTQELIDRAHLDELKGRPLPEVAQAYELRMGRHSLIAYLASRIEDSCYEPSPVHHLIAALPFKGIITTNWDNLLEEALYQAKKPTLKVVRDTDIPFADDEKVLLIKLHGSIEQKDSIVVTGDDYYDVFAHLPETAKEVSAYFAKKTILFLGFGLADDDFGRLYREVVRHLGRHQRRAYAVQLTPSQLTTQQWQQKNVQIIDADAMAFLEGLRGQVTPRKTQQQWLKEGLALINDKHYKEALAAFEKGIKLDPNSYTSASLYVRKGQALHALRRDEEALSANELAIHISSNNVEAHIGKGNILWQLGHYIGALDCYERAIKLSANEAWTRIKDGNALSSKEVSSLYRAFLSGYEEYTFWLDDEDVGTHFRYGIACTKLKRYSEALASFERVIHLAPSFRSAYYCKGLLLEDMEHYQEALQEYERAISYFSSDEGYLSSDGDGPDAFAWRKKGDMLKHIGKDKEAQQAYDKANELQSPEDIPF